MSGATMTLYGAPPTRALRPIWLLNELGLDCDIVPVNPIEPDGRKTLLAVNPFGKAPVLVDGEVTVAESVAIMFHLAETRGGDRFLPADAAARAAMFQWNLFLVTEIEQPLWRISLHTVIYPEAERSAAEVALARRDGRRFLEPLESHLGGRHHVVGDDLTLTDFNAAFTLDWADDEGLLDALPNCRRFVERMYARPAAPPRTSEAFAYLNAGRSRRATGMTCLPNGALWRNRMSDEQDIRILLREQDEAVGRGDAKGVVTPIAGDIVSYDLPPPLESRGSSACDPVLFDTWFATWNGPVRTELRDPAVIVDGDLAVAFGLSLMTGDKKGAGPFSGWNRRTVVLRRRDGRWRIVHDHSSYPMEMDGSGKAATGLMPGEDP